MKTVFKNIETKIMFYSLIIASLTLLVNGVNLIINNYQSIENITGELIAIVLICIFFGIFEFIIWNAIHKIEVDDKTCTFISIHNSITVNISDLKSTELLDFTHPKTIMLYHENGKFLIILHSGFDSTQKQLEAFYNHIKKINPNFKDKCPTEKDSLWAKDDDIFKDE